eukprot:7172-Pelagococcus_subviridis.AAC.2
MRWNKSSLASCSATTSSPTPSALANAERSARSTTPALVAFVCPAAIAPALIATPAASSSGLSRGAAFSAASKSS